MIFQSDMEALRAEPVAEGEMPASSVQLVSKVLSQNSSHQFPKSVGIKTPASSKSASSNQSELREQLAAEATTAIQGELDQLRKKCEEAEEQQARTQRELEEYKKIKEKNSKEMEETNVLIKMLLSLHGNTSSSST
jgi:molecular chaperone GrpE (heat shock protein)